LICSFSFCFPYNCLVDVSQKIIVEQTIPLLTDLWEAWTTGFLGNSEGRLCVILRLLLLASQNTLKGQTLFINALVSSKKDYPQLVAEFWKAYDNWDNIHKTDFFRIEQ